MPRRGFGEGLTGGELQRETSANVSSGDPIDDMFSDPNRPPSISPGAGRQWIFDPEAELWMSDSAPDYQGAGSQAGLDIERQRANIQAGELAESIRANKAREQEMARQRALDAATSAISAYLRGT